MLDLEFFLKGLFALVFLICSIYISSQEKSILWKIIKYVSIFFLLGTLGMLIGGLYEIIINGYRP
ncbi:hypothetical protein M3603_07015 [Rummeliibacillus stabekisii]|uniref:hypothetical protein n=1 Tax=Rummeliibacillus stabekisii TaxID=241244 RepID=UPI00203EE40E|nr:hypothetical protein [Rummeliibacillus stabekisii]MCM3316427.1 hypothetical protein [Rummeliibacillus stabekisii]